MPSVKELPTRENFSNWWGERNKPSKRFLVECETMSAAFPEAWNKLELPHSSWDKREINIVKSSINLKEVNIGNYNFFWDVKFFMADGEFLCNHRDLWEIQIYCPTNYPFQRPAVAVFDKDKKQMANKQYSGDHVNPRDYSLIKKGWFNDEEIRTICFDQHNSNWWNGHDPARTTASIHALRSLLWLRAKLYSIKTNGHMQNYG